MPDALEEFTREKIKEMLESLPAEERLNGLSLEQRLEGLSPEERAKVLSPEQWLEGLSSEAREALRQLLHDNGSSFHPG